MAHYAQIPYGLCCRSVLSCICLRPAIDFLRRRWHRATRRRRRRLADYSSTEHIDVAPSQYKLSFFAENGTPQTLQTNFGTGTFVWGTIPGHGSVTIQTAGTKVALSQGWALM